MKKQKSLVFIFFDLRVCLFVFVTFAPGSRKEASCEATLARLPQSDDLTTPSQTKSTHTKLFSKKPGLNE